MLKTCRFLWITVLCLSSSVLQAAVIKDTTTRSFFKVATPKSVNSEYDIEHLMAGAMSKIQHDSTGQGGDDLLQAMQALADSKQTDRVLTFTTAGLYRDFVKICRSNNFEITDTPVDGLKRLIAQHMYEKEAQLIISQVFGQSTQSQTAVIKP